MYYTKCLDEINFYTESVLENKFYITELAQILKGTDFSFNETSDLELYVYNTTARVKPPMAPSLCSSYDIYIFCDLKRRYTYNDSCRLYKFYIKMYLYSSVQQ